MTKYNPYLVMNYNTDKDTLEMTPDTLKMWLKTYTEASEEVKENIISVINYFTREGWENGNQ